MTAPAERAPVLVAAVLVAAVTVLAYANAAPRALVYDDETTIARNPGLTLRRVFDLFASPARAGVSGNQRLYRPLAMASLALDRAVWAGDPRGYHWTNIGLHASASVLLFALLLALGAPVPAAAAAAAVFGVHPVHTEVVDSAFNRSEILATLGVLGGLWWLWHWLPRRRGLAWTGAAVAYLLALLSRESAVVFPVLAAVVLAGLPAPEPRRWHLRELAVLVLPFAAYLALRQWAVGEPAGGIARSFGAQGILGSHAPAERLALVAATLRDHWRLLVWPHPLQASYEDYRVHGVAAALALHAALLGLALSSRRRHPTLAVGIVFVYVALVPSTRLFADPAVFAERFLYLPSAGLAIPLAAGLAALAGRFGLRPVMGAVAAVVVALGSATWRRNLDWHSAEALWKAELRASPRDWKAHLNLCRVHLDAGRPAEALAVCDRGQAFAPAEPGFETNRGIALLALGRLGEAEAAFRRALELGRGASEALDLARFYVMTGRPALAEGAYTRAIEGEADPARRQAIEGDVLLYCRSDLSGARQAYTAALSLSPGLTLARQGLAVIASRSAGR
jgi:tetratricopeptide (TPR) repeat protein